ncbi:MAG: MOSC N-terminal beta barrel domain-containing protein [Thermostichus sp. BF3_bins_97]
MMARWPRDPDAVNQTMPDVAELIIYPIKSLDGVSLPEVSLTAEGSLQGDRQYALVDAQGKRVNGKRHAQIHRLRAQFDPQLRQVQLWGEGQAGQFDLQQERDPLQRWLSNWFGFPIHLLEEPVRGFPDDPYASGPTLISASTLEVVANWFPGLTPEEMRQRFRMNIELSECLPFWEDHLFAQADQGVRFRIGEVELLGINPCARCIVPTRDPISGAAYLSFQKHFVAQRQKTLPEWAELSRFDHFYRLGLNTWIPRTEAGKRLKVGDPVEFIGIEPLSAYPELSRSSQ